VGKLQAFAQLPGHQEGDCCVVCLLSHGEEGYLFGTDGRKLQLDSIFTLFDNSNCKYLIAKPKMFIIQACRGGINNLHLDLYFVFKYVRNYRISSKYNENKAFCNIGVYLRYKQFTWDLCFV